MIIGLRERFAIYYGTAIFVVIVVISTLMIFVFRAHFISLGLLGPDIRSMFTNAFIAVAVMFLPIGLVISYLVGWVIAKQLHSDRYTIIPRSDDPPALPTAMLEDEIQRKMNSIRNTVEKMRQGYEQIQHFSINASHELRTPLTIMRGEVELALRSEKKTEEYQRILGSLLEEILRLSRILDDLLLVAKSYTGQIDLEHQPINLKTLLEDLADEIEMFTSQFGITFVLDEIQPAVIHGDALRLRRVLLNLIDNATKYNREGGTIRLSMNRDEDWVYIRVQDTGIGIPEEALGKIFDRFYRHEEDRSRSSGGTGLGLYIVKWITESHGGEVLVESTYQKGSTFTLKLPLVSP